jgi:hypothetical protein
MAQREYITRDTYQAQDRQEETSQTEDWSFAHLKRVETLWGPLNRGKL